MAWQPRARRRPTRDPCAARGGGGGVARTGGWRRSARSSPRAHRHANRLLAVRGGAARDGDTARRARPVGPAAAAARRAAAAPPRARAVHPPPVPGIPAVYRPPRTATCWRVGRPRGSPPPPAGRPAWRPPPQWRKACPRLPPGRPRSGAVQRRDPSCRWHARRGRGGGEGRRGIKLRRGRAAALLCRPLHSRRGAALPAAPTSWGSVLLEREWDGGRCPGAQRSRSGWLSKTSRGQRSGHAPGGRPCPRATRPEGGNDTQTRPPATPDAAVGAPLGRKRGGLHRRLAKKRTLACL